MAMWIGGMREKIAAENGLLVHGASVGPSIREATLLRRLWAPGSVERNAGDMEVKNGA